MAFPLFALMLGTQVIAVAASGVPNLDMKPTCSSTARRDLTGSDTKEGTENCLTSEHRARDELAKRWSSFNAGDRESCGTLVKMGGPPSYVELLTCLEMSAEARRARAQEAKNPVTKTPATKTPTPATARKKVRAKSKARRSSKSGHRYRRGWGYHI